MNKDEERLKDILKPIRQEANKATGTIKIIYSEMLRQINERFPGGKVTRQEIIDEIERQRCETQAKLEETKRQVTALDKGSWYVHWKDIEEK